MARYSIILLLLFCTLSSFAQNHRFTSLTVTTGITNLGAFKMTNGASNLRVLTSDANGNASWQPPGSVVDTNAWARLNGLGTNGQANGFTITGGFTNLAASTTNAGYVTTGGPVTNKGETYLEGNVSVVSPAVLSGRISASTVTNSGTLQQNGSAHFTGRVRMVDSTITISGGVALPSRVRHLIDTEAAAASDDLDTLSVIGDDDGFTLILSPADDARTVVIKHNTGNILCAGGADITLDDLQDLAILYFQSGVGWYASPIARDVTQGAVTLEGPVTVQGNLQVTPGSGTVLIDVPLEAGNTFNAILETTLNDVHIREDLYLDGPLIRVPVKTVSGVLDVAGISQGSSWTFNTSTNFSFSFSGAASNGQLATLAVSNFNSGARVFGTNTAGVYDPWQRATRTLFEFESNAVTTLEFEFQTNFVAAGFWKLRSWEAPEWTVEWSTNLVAYTNGATRTVKVTAAAGGGSGDITGGNANQFTEDAGVLTIADGSLQTNNVLRGALTTLGATATTNAGYLTVGGLQTNKSAVRIDATLRITGSGALTMDDILSADVLGTDGSGLVIPRTASAVLDVIGSTRGSILYRGAAGWAILAPGTSGQFLQSQGAGADPLYATPAGGGDFVGPASATDNALMRFDGTTGKLGQNSGAILDDSNNLRIGGAGSGPKITIGSGDGSTNTYNAKSIGTIAGVSGLELFVNSVTHFTLQNAPQRLVPGGSNVWAIGEISNPISNMFAVKMHVKDNVTYESGIFASASQATNHTADYNLAVRHQNLTNDVWYSAVSNVPATNLFRAVVHVFRNASGSTWRIGANNSATGFRMSGTNDVAIASGQQARVYFDTDCTGFAGLTNCTIQVVKFDNP